jgi:uncharacterized membrane protein
MGWLISAVSLVGAIVLGAGVVLLFATNWGEIPDAMRMAVLFGGLVAVYGIAYVLMEKLDMQRLGSAFLLLGVVLFQASLFLVAQIYNMPVESPIIFLLGAIGAFPLAYLFGSRIVLLLAIVAVTTWRVWVAEIALDDGAEEAAVLVIIGAFGVLLYALGRLHLSRSGVLARLGEVYVFAGAVLTLAMVYCATFADFWDYLIEDGAESFAAPMSVYVAIGIAMAAVAVQVFARRRTNLDLADVAAQAGLLAIAVIVATWPAWTGYAVVFNGIFFLLAGAIVGYGYMASDERYVNGGLVAIGIGLLTRYCDTFWSMLAGSAFFIVGGLLLLALAFGLERIRRSILAEMNEPEDDAPHPQQEALA